MDASGNRGSGGCFIERCGRARGYREAALAHQCADARVPAPKRPVALGGIDRIADAEDVLAELGRHGFVVRAASLDERFPRVGGEGVGPQIAVVAGALAQLFQLEVWLYVVLVEVIFRLAYLL